MKKKVVIAGGTGCLGKSIIQSFSPHEVEIIVLTRKTLPATDRVRFVAWDAKTAGDWVHELEGSTAVINLVGKSVNCRYTDFNKKEIIQSRIESTLVLGQAIASRKKAPEVWINAGSAAIFGDGGNVFKDETSATGDGFPAEVCKQWESAFFSCTTPNTRKVLLRMGLVFQKGQGLLQPFIYLVKSGFGKSIGSGQQYITWIHERDFVRLIHWSIEKKEAEGIYNAASPEPVKNEDFLADLRTVLRIPVALPLPTWLIKIGGKIVGTEPELLLKGRRVISKRLKENGFEFTFVTLKPALQNLINVNQTPL